jgi:hypothetical protein
VLYAPSRPRGTLRPSVYEAVPRQRFQHQLGVEGKEKARTAGEKSGAAVKNRLAIILSRTSPEFTAALRDLPPIEIRIAEWVRRGSTPYLAFLIETNGTPLGELVCALPCDDAELRTLVHEERDNVTEWMAAHTASDLVTNTLRAGGLRWGSS